MLTYEDGPIIMDWLVRAFGFCEITHVGRRWRAGAWRTDRRQRAHHGECCNAALRESQAPPGTAGARAWSAAPWVIDGVLVYVVDDVMRTSRKQRRLAQRSRPKSKMAGPDADTVRRTWKGIAGCSYRFHLDSNPPAVRLWHDFD